VRAVCLLLTAAMVPSVVYYLPVGLGSTHFILHTATDFKHPTHLALNKHPAALAQH
jgi:hypothetical protein